MVVNLDLDLITHGETFSQLDTINWDKHAYYNFTQMNNYYLVKLVLYIISRVT